MGPWHWSCKIGEDRLLELNLFLYKVIVSTSRIFILECADAIAEIRKRINSFISKVFAILLAGFRGYRHQKLESIFPQCEYHNEEKTRKTEEKRGKPRKNEEKLA